MVRYLTILAFGLGVWAPSPPSPPAGMAVDALSWLAGTWGSEEKGIRTEEHWSAPAGGLMLGTNHGVRGGKAVSWEFLRIETTPDGLVYYASPRGAPPTPFRLAESGERRVVFTNPAHDFPKRIAYWLDGEGVLHARIEGDAGKGMEWRWQRLDRS